MNPRFLLLPSLLSVLFLFGDPNPARADALPPSLEAARKILEEAKAARREDAQKEAENRNRALQDADRLHAEARQSADEPKLRAIYAESLSLWRQAVDRILDGSQTPPPERAPLPPLPEDGDFDELRAEFNAFTQAGVAAQKELTDRDFALLLATGRLRAETLAKLIELGDESVLSLNQSYLEDLRRELRIVPYRPIAYFHQKVLKIQSELGRGFDGLLSLLREALVLLAFLIIPFVFWAFFRRATRFIGVYRASLQRSERRWDPAFRRRIRWLDWVDPILPWVGLLITIHVAKTTIDGSEVEEIGAILPYLRYYIWYRLFSISLGEILKSAFRSGFAEKAPKAEATARLLGRFAFLSVSVLQLTESVVRRGLAYRLVLGFVSWAGVAIIFWASARWSSEISEALERRFPESRFARRLADLARTPIGNLLCLPIVLALFGLGLLRRLELWLSEYETTKRLSAALFRRKIESAAKKRRGTLGEIEAPSSYSKSFLDGASSDFVDAHGALFEKVTKQCDAWVEGRSEANSIALYGDKGVGKSRLLAELERSMAPRIRVVRLPVPPKVTTMGELRGLIERATGIDLEAGAGRRPEPESTRILLLLDEAQNLFLAKPGAFEAARGLRELLLRMGEAVFWCLAFNRYSWAYLSDTIELDQAFHFVHRVSAWSEEDISALLTKRHESTQFAHTYDADLYSLQGVSLGESQAEVESQYHRMIWDQSRGNPRIAQMIWLSSLRSAGEKRLAVGLPPRPDLRRLDSLSDDYFFVFAAILRHENLNTNELEGVLGLSSTSLRGILSKSEEMKVLERSRDRYRISPLWQGLMTQVLVGKNMIYD